MGQKKNNKKKFTIFFIFCSSSFMQIFANVDNLTRRTMDENGYHPSHHDYWSDYSEDQKDTRSYIGCLTRKQAMAFVALQLLKDSYLREHLIFLGDFMLWKIVLYWSKKIEKNLVHKAIVTSHQRYKENAQLFFLSLKKIQKKIKELQEEKYFQESMEENKKILQEYQAKFVSNKLFIEKFHKNVVFFSLNNFTLK